jgi:CO dehydrogenase nickel-insertion accessory protein CooC1
VTVVDFKAGIEDASRGVITQLDWVVVVIDPSYAALQAAVTLRKLVEQMRAGHLPATHHLGSPGLVELTERQYRSARIRGVRYVLNKVADSDTEYELRQRLLDAGIQATAVIREEPGLQRAWLEGAALECAQAASEAAKIVRAFEADQAAQIEAAPESRAADAVGC